MNLSDIRFVILALHLMRDPQRRTALLRLWMGSAMSPTRYRPTSCNGDGIGMGLVIQKTEKSYLAAVLSPCWFRSGTSL